MNRSVAIIWWGMLIATVAGVVPVAVSLLSRVLKAARNIERYTAEALDGGVKIAGNTASIAALKDTIAVAPGLLAATSSLEQHTASIAAALAPAAADSSVPATDSATTADGGSGSGMGGGRVAGQLDSQVGSAEYDDSEGTKGAGGGEEVQQ